MSNQAVIRDKLNEFITETFLIGSDIEKIEPSDSFMEHEIIDSTGILELTAYVESEFDLTIEDDEMTPENLDSIDKLTRFIVAKKE
jgi:acyl carrier protein